MWIGPLWELATEEMVKIHDLVICAPLAALK